MLVAMEKKAEETILVETFGSLADNLSDVDTSTFKYQNSKTRLLSLDSGRLLKSRFGGFNDTLQAMHSTMSSLTLPDPNREKLLRSGRGMVQERYQAFFEKYSVYTFSKKNQAEYTRYPPILAESVFADLFQG
jgi:hypothetical protein